LGAVRRADVGRIEEEVAEEDGGEGSERLQEDGTGEGEEMGRPSPKPERTTWFGLEVVAGELEEEERGGRGEKEEMATAEKGEAVGGTGNRASWVGEVTMMEDWREDVEAEKRELLDAEEGRAMLGRGVRAEGSAGFVGEEEEEGDSWTRWEKNSSCWVKENSGAFAELPPIAMEEGTETLSRLSDWIITVNSSSTSPSPSPPSVSGDCLPFEYSKLQSESLVDKLLELVIPTFELVESLRRVVAVLLEASGLVPGREEDVRGEGRADGVSILAERDWYKAVGGWMVWWVEEEWASSSSSDDSSFASSKEEIGRAAGSGLPKEEPLIGGVLIPKSPNASNGLTLPSSTPLAARRTISSSFPWSIRKATDDDGPLGESFGSGGEARKADEAEKGKEMSSFGDGMSGRKEGETGDWGEEDVRGGVADVTGESRPGGEEAVLEAEKNVNGPWGIWGLPSFASSSPSSSSSSRTGLMITLVFVDSSSLRSAWMMLLSISIRLIRSLATLPPSAPPLVSAPGAVEAVEAEGSGGGTSSSADQPSTWLPTFPSSSPSFPAFTSGVAGTTTSVGRFESCWGSRISGGWRPRRVMLRA
jgi:hypothetical protein